MDNSTKFLIYAGVLLIFGGLFGVSIVFFLWSSVKLSDKFQDDLTKSLAHKTLEWLEKQKVIKLAGRVNKVIYFLLRILTYFTSLTAFIRIFGRMSLC